MQPVYRISSTGRYYIVHGTGNYSKSELLANSVLNFKSSEKSSAEIAAIVPKSIEALISVEHS